MGTVSDLMNSLTRPVRHYRIKVVPNADPNADGEWIDCGTQQFPEKEKFRDTCSRLSGFCPKDHHIVQLETS